MPKHASTTTKAKWIVHFALTYAIELACALALGHMPHGLRAMARMHAARSISVLTRGGWR